MLDYIRFNGTRHPRKMGKPEIERFLSHLAVNRNVASSTQNQALRVRPKINSHFQALRRPHGKTRGG